MTAGDRREPLIEQGKGPVSEQQAQYDEATLADLQDMARTVLPNYGYSPSARIRLLNISENATYLVEDGVAERRLILRVHRVGYHSREGIESELDWLRALRRDRIAEVIEPVADRSGATIQTLVSRRGGPDRMAVAFGFFEGQQPSPNDDLLPWFEVLGELTARLHLQAKTWRRPNGFVRQVWDADAMHGQRRLWGPWQDALGLDRAGHALLDRAVAKVRARLDEFGPGPERFGLIHADLRLANLLIDGDRLKVLDFDDCGFSWFMYDFASAVSFYEHLPNVPALRDSWLTGYAKIAAVTDEDRAILPTVVMARRILLLAWVASHREVPTAQELGTTYTDQSLDLAERYLGDRFLRE
jgi:Ser/Thr protein kinase RdoA (MazF antagonist)